jgi:hypothetical protein
MPAPRWRSMKLTPFALHARRACPSHAELALALGRRVPRAAAGRWRGARRAGRAAPRGRGRHAGRSARVLRRGGRRAVRARRFAMVRHRRPPARSGRRRRVGASARARRGASRPRGGPASSSASWRAAPAASSRTSGSNEPRLLDVARGRLVAAGGLTGDVAWQCAHQVAARILNRIGERARGTGNIAWALRAGELRLALPFTRPGQRRARPRARAPAVAPELRRWPPRSCAGANGGPRVRRSRRHVHPAGPGPSSPGAGVPPPEKERRPPRRTADR